MVKWSSLLLGVRRRNSQLILTEYPELQADMDRLAFIWLRNRAMQLTILLPLCPFIFVGVLIALVGRILEFLGRQMFEGPALIFVELINSVNKMLIGQAEAEALNDRIEKAVEPKIIPKRNSLPNDY